MGLGDPKTFVYQVTFYKEDTDNTHIIDKTLWRD